MKILLVTDVNGWAWDHKADGLIKVKPKDYDIRKKMSSSVEYQDFKKYNLVYFFGWNNTRFPNLSACGISSYNFRALHKRQAFSVLPKFKAIGAVSKELYLHLKDLKLNRKIYNVPNGVDHEIFRPAPNKDKFTVGWVGQPTDGRLGLDGGRVDYHGYLAVLPHLKRMLEENKIEFRTVITTWKNAHSPKYMAQFYNSLDVFVSTCYKAGTPNPAFEASACGVPVITTNCGAIQDAITDGTDGFLVGKYRNWNEGKEIAKAFMEKILFLRDNPDLRKKIGESAREMILSKWTWEKMFANYNRMFREVVCR